ncbi:DUF2288 family protein [Synechococcales cyanobacterium C]|uniref:DUF2288 family protein n=1 Tax=Petrachloros mirabilis ULC683 TaxID=2781853 RepID=A0A8K2ANC1_9CYAN|nr:DUF2288 domain-containing protein [Petrachloros mirabilis]NCJ05346.1 DUF2288 family protein [Petrachloros mirabilis ULC683]
MEDIKTRLRADLAEVLWQDLIPHSKRDAVIVVSPTLDLVSVGVAIAEDNTALVQLWIQQSLVYKPTPAQLSDWNAHVNTVFCTLIVQPFVLVRAPEALA